MKTPSTYGHGKGGNTSYAHGLGKTTPAKVPTPTNTSAPKKPGIVSAEIVRSGHGVPVATCDCGKCC